MRPVHTDTGQLISADTEKRPKWAIHIKTGTANARIRSEAGRSGARSERSDQQVDGETRQHRGDQLLWVVESLEQLHQQPETTEQNHPGAEGQHPSPHEKEKGAHEDRRW